MNLKIQLYNRIMRRYRLRQLKAPPCLIDKETADIDGLKNKIAKNHWRYKIDKMDIADIEFKAMMKIESLEEKRAYWK